MLRALGSLVAFSGASVAPEPSSILFQVDFSTLALGGHAAGPFLTATGLTFTRSSGSTVQTSSSALVSGLGTDVACIGDRTGAFRGLVIQHNVKNILGGSGNNSPRDLTVTWTTAGATPATAAYAAGPDGVAPGVGCSRASFSSGSLAPYGVETTTARRCFSSWQRSTDENTNGDMQMGWISSSPGDGGQVVRAASNTWARLVLAKGTASRTYFDVADGRDYSSSGGQTARARDVLVDYIQYEAGDFATEAIPTSGTRRKNDRLSHSDGSELVEGGRLKLWMKFVPKHASTMDVFFDGDSASGTAGHWYLWSFGGDGDNYARIDATTKKLEVSVSGVEEVTTNALAWAQFDELELYLEVGANVASVAKYRVNGGAWADLELGTLADAVAPAGAFALLHNDKGTAEGDSGQLPCWLRALKFYNALGSHPIIEITSITPDHGSEDGGTSVTIAGAGFLGANQIILARTRDGSPGTNLGSMAIVDNNTITGTTPAKPMFGGSPAHVYVVRNVGQPDEVVGVLEDAFTYDPPGAAPTVVGISPALGDTGGGIAVIIEVDDSTGATGASVGGVALTSFAIEDATHVSGVTGAHAAGDVDVTVTNGIGTSDPLVDGFEYWGPSVESPSLLLLPGDYAVTGTQGVDAVGTWTDSSGNGLDAVSASGTSAPAAASGCPDFVAADALHLAVAESIADGGTPMASLTAGTIIAIFEADAANANDTDGNTAYQNGVICAGVNASPACCFTDAGVKLVAYDEDVGEADYKGNASNAAATGVGHIAFYRWSGGTIGSRVNGGSFTTNTLVAGTLSSGNVGSTTEIGRSFGGAQQFDGRLKLLAILAPAASDAVCDKFHVWATGKGYLG